MEMRVTNLHSNGVEETKTSERTEPVKEEELIEAQITETKLATMIDIYSGVKELEQDSSPILAADKKGPLPGNVKMSSVFKNLELLSQDPLTNLEKGADVLPGTASLRPCNRRLEPSEKDVGNDSGQFDDENKVTPAQERERNSKLKSPVTSLRVLGSKTQEKPQAPEPIDTAKEGSANEEKKSRQKKTKAIKKTDVDEFSRMRTHLRYLLRRITYEQSLIDAYSAEGWRGQSLEKLKPAKELQHAKSHILRYKLRIRELFQSLDTLLAEGKLPESLFDSEGEIDSEDIFCAKCGCEDRPLDNDIILCDGVCERGFHQLCLEPPLLTEDIPQDDEGWLCPGCDCKADCIGMLNDFQEAIISITDNWEKIFPEVAASGKKLDGGSGISSDDSEDDDYDPDKADTVQEVEGDKSSSDESNYLSARDELVASPSNENFMGFPFDDSEDDDFDPTAPNPDKQVEHESSSSDFTSDSEDLGALLDDATTPGGDSELNSPSSDHNQASAVSKKEKSVRGGMKGQSIKDELSYLFETSDEPVAGKRQVERLDYKKLHDETFGNTSDSSDNDYEDSDDSDTSAPKRRKINHEKSEVTPPC